MNAPIPLDDLQAAARASWQIAHEICTCADLYHAIHPVLRATGFTPGIATDRGTLNGFLPAMVAPGARLLIAGAADASLVQYFVENCPARPLSITVIDRCPAPLALIGRMRLPEGVTIETRQGQLAELAERDRYDLVLSHDMMNFIDEATRLEVIDRLSQSLTAEGRFILVARVAEKDRAVSQEELTRRHIAAAEGKFADFPDLVRTCGEGLRDLLRKHLRERTMRPGRVLEPAEIVMLIERAGARLERKIAGAVRTTFHLADGSKRQRQSHIFIIRRSGAATE